MREKKLLSARHPVLYKLAVETHRLRRMARWMAHSDEIAGYDDTVVTEDTVARHRSLLLRQLGDVDMTLQYNKITNLALAIDTLNGRLIRPGQTLSFWQCVGKPTAANGYKNGLLLENGRAVSGVGGGLCQMANLLYWLALHTPLQVVEHHHHGFDIFPDSGRQVPFGSGAAVFYNYVDLRIYNPTSANYRLNVWLTDTQLRGEIKTDMRAPVAYHMREEGHRFFRMEGRIYRENYLYRDHVDRNTGNKVKSELITHNLFPVLYTPHQDIVIEELPERTISRIVPNVPASVLATL